MYITIHHTFGNVVTVDANAITTDDVWIRGSSYGICMTEKEAVDMANDILLKVEARKRGQDAGK